VIVRKPRPKLRPRPKLYPRQKKFTVTDERKQLFLKTIQELRPFLMREAGKVSIPSFIDKEDLVQEAYLKMFKNLDKYDETRASIKTWCMYIARKNFLNTAVTAFRKDSKYTPKDPKQHVKIEVMKNQDISVDKIKSYPYSCQAKWDYRYKEILEHTEKRLKPFARRVLHSLLTPPEELVNKIKNDRIQKMRERHVGLISNLPFEFVIRNNHLAEFFHVPYYKIARAKDEIYAAINDAIAE